jgi:hypothetical protein
MQAFRLVTMFPTATDAALMANFRRFHFNNFLENTETVELEVVGGQVRLVGQPQLASFKL